MGDALAVGVAVGEGFAVGDDFDVGDGDAVGAGVAEFVGTPGDELQPAIKTANASETARIPRQRRFSIAKDTPRDAAPQKLLHCISLR